VPGKQGRGGGNRRTVGKRAAVAAAEGHPGGRPAPAEQVREHARLVERRQGLDGEEVRARRIEEREARLVEAAEDIPPDAVVAGVLGAVVQHRAVWADTRRDAPRGEARVRGAERIARLACERDGPRDQAVAVGRRQPPLAEPRTACLVARGGDDLSTGVEVGPVRGHDSRGRGL
jgi:hypothetical protein